MLDRQERSRTFTRYHRKVSGTNFPEAEGREGMGKLGRWPRGGRRRAEEPGQHRGERPSLVRNRTAGRGVTLLGDRATLAPGREKAEKQTLRCPALIHRILLHHPALCLLIRTAIRHSRMWLFKFKLIKMKSNYQFSHTSHISSAQWPHAPSGYDSGQQSFQNIYLPPSL